MHRLKFNTILTGNSTVVTIRRIINENENIYSYAVQTKYFINLKIFPI